MRGLDVPEFRPRAPWWGPDLQTLRNTLAPPPVRLERWPATRVELPTGDGTGDTLLGLRQEPEGSGPAALVVLLHGLGGCEDSVYMQRSAEHWLERGHPVLRLNLRGAGPSGSRCREHYHAGRTEDLVAALGELPAPGGLVLVGYSLGGGLLLKFLAEHGERFPVRAAAAVSAPLDLSACSRRIATRRNAVYQRHLLRRLRREMRSPALPPERMRAVARARSIREFDEVFVAPQGGFASAEDYYARSSAAPMLGAIRVPTLLIQALDDPWIPARIYTDRDWSALERVTPLLSRGGGHLGFHARDDRTAWHDRAIAAFVAGR